MLFRKIKRCAYKILWFNAIANLYDYEIVENTDKDKAIHEVENIRGIHFGNTFQIKQIIKF